MDGKIQDVLEKVGDEGLTVESRQAIAEAFDEAVNSKVTERVELEVVNALQQLDEEHAAKLTTLLETIDADYSKKLLNVVKKIDEDHANKLKSIIKRYNVIINEEAVNFRNNFIDEISNYLELYLDRAIPTRQIAEATENTQARKMIEQIKKIVAVDKAFINENVREALQDGKNTIDTLRSELNKVIKENVEINKKLNNTHTALILEKNTSSFPSEKRNFVMRVLKDKNPDYVKDNFNFVVEMYNRQESDSRDIIKEEAQQAAVSNQVATPKLVLESVSRNAASDDGSNNPIDGYLKELNRVDSSSKRK